MSVHFRSWPARLLLILAIPALHALPAQAQDAQALKWINMRAGPARDYPLVAQFPPDSMLAVQGCTDGYGWCDVIGPTGARGWVYAGNLVYLDQGSALPLLGYGDRFGIPVIGFMLGSYWGSYYQGQPFYGRRQEWRGRDIDRGGRPGRIPPAPNRPMMASPPNRPSAPPPGARERNTFSPGQIRPRGAPMQPAAAPAQLQGASPGAGRPGGGGGPPGGGRPGGGGGPSGGGHPGGGGRPAGDGQPGREGGGHR